MFTLWTYLVALHEPCDPETLADLYQDSCWENFPEFPGRCIQDFCRHGNKFLCDDVMDGVICILSQRPGAN